MHTVITSKEGSSSPKSRPSRRFLGSWLDLFQEGQFMFRRFWRRSSDFHVRRSRFGKRWFVGPWWRFGSFFCSKVLNMTSNQVSEMSGWIILTKTEVLRIWLLWLRIFSPINPFWTYGRLENNLKSLNKSRYCINEHILACLLRFFTPHK
jgi:hypothetical protein